MNRPPKTIVIGDNKPPKTIVIGEETPSTKVRRTIVIGDNRPPKTIVIGDIHGCYNELKTMITELKEEGVYDKDRDKLIFLGDYIDRGKDSRKVVEYIRRLQSDVRKDANGLQRDVLRSNTREGGDVVALMGKMGEKIDTQYGIQH